MPAETGRSLASEEPYMTAFEATVTAVDGTAVRLDATHFYAEGGGQPPDRGTIDGIPVIDVQTVDGETVHTLDDTPPFAVGDTVAGHIDVDFRTHTMRAHTASHILYGAGRRALDARGYGGFDIGNRRVRLDFLTDVDATDVDPLELQRLASEAIWDSLDVTSYEMALEEARADPDIVFNLGDAAPTDTVRIVEIDGWDISACGGTHVRNTIEVGPLAVTDVSNPGAEQVRVEFAVGPVAIDRQLDTRRAASEAASALDTSVEHLPDRAAEIQAETERLEADLQARSEALLDAQLVTLADATVTRDDSEWLVGAVSDLGPNTVADHLRGRDGLPADVLVLTGRDGATFLVVATDGETDANEVIDAVTDEFGGGGGGQPTLAQGGGLQADPEAVVSYLRGE